MEEEKKTKKYNVEYGVKCKVIFPETELKIKTQSPANMVKRKFIKRLSFS